MAVIVIELTGSKSKLVYEELPSDDPTQRKPDIELAKSEFGWEPNIQLEGGTNEKYRILQE